LEFAKELTESRCACLEGLVTLLDLGADLGGDLRLDLLFPTLLGTNFGLLAVCWFLFSPFVVTVGLGAVFAIGLVGLVRLLVVAPPLFLIVFGWLGVFAIALLGIALNVRLGNPNAFPQ